MCTMIAAKLPVDGSAKGGSGWFAVDQAYVAYDHPTHAPLEHALMLDFVNEDLGPGARVAVELPRDQAAELAARITAALEEAEAHEVRGVPRSGG